MNKCTRCSKLKEPTEFKFRKDQNKLSTRCKECESFCVKANFFKVTPEELEVFIDSKNHKCEICGIAEEDARQIINKTKHYGLYIDHDHSNGKLRGMLCHHCNLIIGHAKDDIATLHKAIDYLT